MSVQLNTITPLSYNDWLSKQTTLNANTAQLKYVEYLNDWYRSQGIKNNQLTNKIKDDYVQLIKDLSFLFGKKEKDQFLADIDFNKDEELIFSIPFFAKKLKEIAILLSKKRETVKEAKLKYNLIGSNNGLERLMYEYVLKGFTRSEDGISQIPTYHLSNLFPELSSIKDKFYIEVEELHDPNTYFDSDPSVSINEYVDVEDLLNQIPFEGLNENEIIGLISTRYLPRIAPTPLSNLFKNYLQDENIIDTTVSLSSLSALISNQINASIKYMGEPRYGLTAIRLRDVYLPDKQISINMPQGNSWFLWPSGDRVLNDLEFNNTYVPIKLNESSLLESGATAGSSIFLSDLIFTEKNGMVEGAWLHGTEVSKIQETMQINLERVSFRDFIFPFVGFNVTPKGNVFDGYNIKDTIFETFNLFDPIKKRELLEAYYTSNLPNSGSHIIYLNQTKLIDQGAHAGKYPDESDCITNKYKVNDLPNTYTDANNGALDEAFLFKYDETDLVVKEGITNIQWPIQIFDSQETPPVSISLKSDTCVPVILGETDPSRNMIGAVAGFDFENSDVIYKLSNDTDEPIEAAWLAGQSINNLDLNYKSISIYDTSAVKCSVYNEGAIQPGLTFKANPSEKISFVWSDVDTPVDEVFKYVEHSSNCLYGKNKHDYYEDQDYRNPNPLFFKNHWTECTCKSVNFSPIGHRGNEFIDYNASADFIFADPDNVGVDFALNSWSDTRNLNYKKSPQFAFYQLSENSNDAPIGWGEGKWKTPNEKPFILKTGRRYTYCRSSFRKNKSVSDQSPYMIVKYPYKQTTGFLSLNNYTDLVIIVDTSYTQKFDINDVKKIVSDVSKRILNDTNKAAQISVITFGTFSSVLSFLTKDANILDLYISSINVSENVKFHRTNILEALEIADYILHTNTDVNVSANLRDLCSNLNFIIGNPILKTQYSNVPYLNGSKEILLFTNGIETVNVGLGLPQAEKLKKSGVKIFVADVGIKQNNYELAKQFASDDSSYFNLQKYLLNLDGNPQNFSEYISYRLGDQTPIKPSWNKAIRNGNGAWVSTSQASDMLLSPGDYIIYVHRNNVNYSSITDDIIFSTPAIDFTINVKLDGWDYENNYFSLSAIGPGYGAKPYWAKVYTDINIEKNFLKETSKSGGNVYFVNGYVPVYQPEISNMILGTGDFLRYKRIANTNLNWSQPLNFNVLTPSNTWKKIKISKEYSNIQKIINRNKLDILGEATNEPSDIVLESYSSFNPAFYNYYARNQFTYNQDLFTVKRCGETFVTYNTAVEINPAEPYVNLLNTQYPTVATVSFPSKSYTTKEIGEYMIPENLGVSTYRGRGYNIKIDNDSLTNIDSMSAERIFGDIGKYGPRQRGLTKKDQLTPVKIENIDNSWIYEPYGRNERSGVLTDTKNNQKFTPYQTSYEVENENKYGVSRQDDIFQFWSPPIPATWNEPVKYPLTFRKEVLPLSYKERKDLLLVDFGKLHNWRTDIFGNDYGLYKHIIPTSLENLLVWYKSTHGTLSAYNQNTAFNGPITTWLDKSGNGKHLVSYSSTVSSSFAYERTAPTLSANVINGKPALYFDGNASLHTMFNLIELKELTVYIVGKFLDVDTIFSSENYQPMLHIGLSSENNLYSTQYFDNQTFTFFQKNNKNTFGFGNPFFDSEAPNLSGSPVVFDYNRDSLVELENSNQGFKVFGFVFNQPSAITYINRHYYLGSVDINKYLDRPLYTTDGENQSGGLWVGSYGGGQFPTKCYISEIFIFDRALSIKERLDMENYLGTEYKLF
jgi:hypothetical protein